MRRQLSARIPEVRRWFADLLRGALAVALASTMAFGERLSAEPASAPRGVPHAARRSGSRGLGGHVLPALAKATRLPRMTQNGAKAGPVVADEPMTITLVLRRDDEAGFQRFLSDAYDPRSPRFRRWLTAEQQADMFGPSPAAYQALLDFGQAHGFALVEGSRDRLTMTLRGTRALAEAAFHVTLSDFERGGRRFYANESDPELPEALAPHVQAVVGLSSLEQPSPSFEWLKKQCDTAYGPTTCAVMFAAASVYLGLACAVSLSAVFALAVTGVFALVAILPTLFLCTLLFALNSTKSTRGAISPAVGTTGAGQKVGIVAYDAFQLSDISDFLGFVGLPASQLSQLSVVPVNGGTSIGSGEAEVVLDISTVMAVAPGALVSVYEAPFSASFQTIFNQMIGDGVTIISNSWTYCEDQTSLANVQSIDSILSTAAAAGITVLNASGDSGAVCWDGHTTVHVPADAPHATAVGGTTAHFGSTFEYAGETWWDGAGGYGVSRFFARPSYQNGLTTSAGRSVPDIASAADPGVNGVPLCIASQGGCPDGNRYGGTSFATPSVAGLVAHLNEAQGEDLGFLNAALYPLAGTSVFHTPASMGSDFAHVGLGSIASSNLNLALAGLTPGPGSASASHVAALPLSVPADGATASNIIVQLRDAHGSAVPGRTVSLTKSGGSAVISAPSGVSAADGTVTFSVTDTVIEDVTFTAHDVTDGVDVLESATVHFVSRPATQGTIISNPGSVPPNGTSTSIITVTLKDANNDGTPGKLVTISQGTGHSIITGPSPAVTDSNGIVQFTVTNKTSEIVNYNAVDVTDGNLAVPGPATVNFTGSPTACTTIPTAAAGYTITPWITGFLARDVVVPGVTAFCQGAGHPAFDGEGVVVVERSTGNVFRLGLEGGTVSNSNKISNLGIVLIVATYGKDGRLYAIHANKSTGIGSGDVIEIDPRTGAQLRVLASNLTCAAGLITDPISGDLFFTNSCFGSGENKSLYRLHDPAGTPSVSVYATMPNVRNNDLSFSPDGTLYLLSDSQVVKVTGTDKPQPAIVTPVTNVQGPPRVVETLPDGSAKSLAVLQSNQLRLVDVTQVPPVTTAVFANGSIGPSGVGPDGCLYANTRDTLYRITTSTGQCSFHPTGPLPGAVLTPKVVAPNPAQGTPAALTASISNVTPLEGTPVFFGVDGANQLLQLVTADASGVAHFSYTGVHQGSDVVTAAVVVDGKTFRSNNATVTWGPGKHSMDVNPSNSPTAAFKGSAATLTATLTDLSLTPAGALAGATVHFDVNGQGCNGVTNAGGVASCAIAPATQGNFTLTASYAGDGTHLAAAASVPFTVTGPLRGDANGSGVRDVLDAFYLINALFAGGPPAANACRGDVNDDGATDVLDVFYLINFLFAGGAPPPPC